MKISLLATDLDGTLIGGGTGELSLYEDFRQALDLLRRKYGALWVVSTGRSLHSFERVFSAMRLMDILPDYVIVRHAYIYRRTKSGRYRPHHSWNFQIRYHIWSSRLYIKDALNSWYQMILDTVDSVTTVYHRRNRLCLRFDSETEADTVAAILRKKAKGFKYLRVFQFSQEVDVRMVPFTKGLALGELADRLGIAPANILAIGNGHNDISMLDGRSARMTGCPQNAETDVMAVINTSRGHIAERKLLGGVIDVINAYLNDSVNSELPDWWQDTRLQKNPKSSGRYMNHPPKARRRKRKKITAIVLVLAILYAVLLVFANFGVLPGSGLIRKPLVLFMNLLMKIIDLFGG